MTSTLVDTARRRGFRTLLNLWPPYLGAGIRVTRIDPSYRRIDVELAMRPWNRNYVGTHFGGSLFAMTDPFYMLMLLRLLGPGYVVWDKSARIRYRKPGRGTVRARFEIPGARVAEIRREADAGGKAEPTFTVDVLDAAGEVVAEVEKVLSVRPKRAAGSAP